ncbi:MAG TPA: NADH-quinone oxidoreductase subunit C [Negativicutes bacterium]|nr:NADH-quinone oxidoreductase subunit C [Negativicutes bacterium]
MGEEQKIKAIEAEELLNKVAGLFKEGYRLVQIGCTRLEYFQLNYSFDKDLNFVNLRLNITQDFEVSSITSIYTGAFLYENEIHDLFGINFKHINIDYKGNLYKTAVKAPFGKEENHGQ